ncbi:MAG: hypothetical protein ACTSVZ_13000, partial [Promethearchaeota archaeon]
EFLTSKSTQKSQSSKIILKLDKENHTYSVHFGDGRAFTRGIVRIYYKEKYYSSFPQEDNQILDFVSEALTSPTHSLGKCEKTTWTWQIPQTKLQFATSFLYFQDRDYVIFESNFDTDPIDDLATGEFEKPSFVFPSFINQSPNRRIITFKNSKFAASQRIFRFALAPVIFFDDQKNTILLSSLDHHLTNGIAKTPLKESETESKNDYRVECGFNGEVISVPRSHSHQFLFIVHQGINATFNYWGDLLRKYYNVERKDRYSDVVNSKLGYWTDNGAFYYYLPMPGKKMDATLIEIEKKAADLEIPFQYYQLDSWWYQKSISKWIRSLLGWLGRIVGGGLYGGTHLWEPDSTYLGISLEDLHQELNLKSFIAHNRWYSDKSPYIKRFKFIVENNSAMPDDPKFWDYLMEYCKKNHIQVYEQDWISTHYKKFSQFRTTLGFGERWLRDMATAAQKEGITIQYCMATPAVMMYSLQFTNITNIRASDDYAPRWLHMYDVPYFTQTSMLVHALGCLPFKDTYHGTRIGRFTGERCPELMALISNLSAGPVGPGSPVDGFNVPILHAMCRKDGLLYKPDRPLTPVDSMFIPNTLYYVCSTESKHSPHTWYYTLTANFWPKRVIQKNYSLSVLGIGENVVEYDWFTQNLRKIIMGPVSESESESELEITQDLKFEEYKYRIYAPLHPRGYALVGDPTKFVMLNDKEFTDVEYNDLGMQFTLNNVENSESPILIYSEIAPKTIVIDGEVYNFSNTGTTSVKGLTFTQYDKNSKKLTFTVEFSSQTQKHVKIEF